MKTRWLTMGFLVVSMLCLCLPGGSPAMASDTGGVETVSSRMPLTFIENQGQVDAHVRYYLSGATRDIWLAEDGIWVTVHQPGQNPAPTHPASAAEDAPAAGLVQHLRISFPGANPHPVLEPIERLETHVSYFIGADPTKWRTDIPVWGGVRYVGLYPGVDLDVSGQSGAWQWRLQAEPGAALDRVQLRVEGADGLALGDDRLRVATQMGEFSLPLLEMNGGRDAAAGAQLTGDQVVAPFVAEQAGGAALPAADQPSDLLYATFLGGDDDDYGYGIAVDGASSVYVTGHTASTGFPAAFGPGYDTTHNGWYDAFVVKLNPTGTALDYAAYLGGDDRDYGVGIAVDSAGSACVTGDTLSSDFPAAVGPGPSASYNGGGDAFVAKLDPAGTSLSYATFLGGEDYDYGRAIAVDSTGSAYVTGITGSGDFIAASGPGYDTSYNGGDGDVFVVKLNASGTTLGYATFLGGNGGDRGWGIAVDSAGSAYVTGTTTSNDFPAAAGPGYDTSHNGEGDAFVVKLNPAGMALSYATFLGGSDWDDGYDIAVDSASSAYITGATASNDFPAASGPGFDTIWDGGTYDAYVVKVNLAGSDLTYATFLGGSDWDVSQGITVDGVGNAYVTGHTHSSDFPAAYGPGFDTSHNGGDTDAFLVKLAPVGTALSYATFLGGSDWDDGCDVAADSAGNAYVTGGSMSSDFPAVHGPGYDTSHNSSGAFDDAFVVKMATGVGATKYSISGRVTDSAGTGLQGVTVSASGGGTATTAASGAYTVTGLITDTYTLTPTKSGYSFTPSTRMATVPPSQTGQDFTASAQAGITFDLPLRSSVEGMSPAEAFAVTFNRCTTSFFDHRYPLEKPGDGQIWMFTGVTLPGSLTECQLFETCYDSHEGYDFDDLPVCGSGVFAAAAGEVINDETGWGNDGYGYRVAIRHGSTGYKTLYGHLAEILVSSGSVEKGTRIGTIGESGCPGCGTHLHFNTYHNGVLVDPSSWFGRTADPWEQQSGAQSLYLWPYSLSRSGKIYGATGGSITSASGNVRVAVPAGASSDALDFVVMDAPVANPSATLSPTGYSFFLQARDSLGNLVSTFGKPLDIVISFSRAALRGVKLDTLSLYVWNESSAEWEVLDTDVDLGSETATSQTTHLSYFALMGQPVQEAYLPVIRK